MSARRLSGNAENDLLYHTYVMASVMPRAQHLTNINRSTDSAVKIILNVHSTLYSVLKETVRKYGMLIYYCDNLMNKYSGC
jgi:hypothetical protein